MCGIVAVIGNEDVSFLLLDALKRLEYRGYDSAGIATINEAGQIDRLRSQGKLRHLEALYHQQKIQGTIGVGHTRWATHGKPTEINAHPHTSEKVAVVHNGIIENYLELRDELKEKGHVFQSETDTEVVAHLVQYYMDDQGMLPKDAAFKTFDRLKGAYSVVLIFKEHKDFMIGTRFGTPLTIGYGDGENYLASDAVALANMTNRVSYLNDGDRVIVSQNQVDIFDEAGNAVKRDVIASSVTGTMTSKGEYRHYMLKEIYEQPEALADTFKEYIDFIDKKINHKSLKFKWKKLRQIKIVACGTSYYAASVGKYWFESMVGISTDIEIASEFRSRKVVLSEGILTIFISQSGETLDTLEALKNVKKSGNHSLAIVNVPESSIAREADQTFYTHAGPEIGVASTKAFVTQLGVLASLVLEAGQACQKLSVEQVESYISDLQELPAHIVTVLKLDEEIKAIAKDIYEAKSILYIGRGTSFPIAQEGALKLKELSYIHAEAYAAGELKHGPISLIDEELPIVAVAPRDDLFAKTKSNVIEVISRGAQVLFISDHKGVSELQDQIRWSIALDHYSDFITPIIYTIPQQLLAYHVAVIKGTDVDQPRNLAKSVTVE